VALATPPDATLCVPPLLMKVTKVEPPLSMTCEPPLTIVALSALPNTSCSPPLRIVAA
jgi:hypothetical protein